MLHNINVSFNEIKKKATESALIINYLVTKKYVLDIIYMYTYCFLFNNYTVCKIPCNRNHIIITIMTLILSSEVKKMCLFTSLRCNIDAKR